MGTTSAGLPRRVLTVLVVVLVGLSAWLPPGGARSPDVPVGVWPLQPEPDVVAPFAPPLTPYGAGHRGVDLAGWLGQPVRAAMAGRVRFASVLAGRGVVVVDHGATRTTYEPVVASVSVADRVSAGDRIGVLEVARSHCYPQVCLHWGWRRGEVYLDPLLLVGDGEVRLLPLDGRPDADARASPRAVLGPPRVGDPPITWWLRRGGGPGRTPGATGPW